MQGSVTFLGTGASMGVPVIGCNCSVCTSHSRYNKRLRPSLMIEVGRKKILIDVGPDFRQQALLAELKTIDGLIITHTHFDHIAGLDELRIYTLKEKRAIPVLLSKESFEELKVRYHYLFKERHPFGNWVVNLDFHVLEEERGPVSFQGIPTYLFSYKQGSMPVLGFKIGNFAYVTDIKTYEETIFEDLKGVDILVVSALRETSSYVHFTLQEAVEFAQKVGAKQTFFTHLAHELDFDESNAKLPEHIRLSYDGLKVEFKL